MHPALPAAAVLLTLALPAPAMACGGSGFTVLHSAAPLPLPAGTIIAEVAFDAAAPTHLDFPGARVRVLGTIQGPAAPALILRPRESTSCDRAVPAGARGLIVGVVTGTNEAGIPVVDPISVPIAEGRLPDGFRLPATRLGSRP